MTPRTHDAAIDRAVEKQMRNWEISRAQHRAAAPVEEVADFITLANIVGAGGKETAKALGEALGWPVFDRELVTQMAQDNETMTGLYRSMDERDLGWLEMTLRPLVDRGLTKNDYFHRLIRTVLCLARKAPAVFVGRSVDLILPKTKGLRIKLIASLDYCARSFAQRNNLSLEEARAEIDRIEAERRDFIRHHFHMDAYDPNRFDLLINVERFAPHHVVGLILAAHADRLALLAPS
jgi:cytidylate kinase